ncbi:MAG: RluA family pseudouridine synthase [Calditrichia bacterium]
MPVKSTFKDFNYRDENERKWRVQIVYQDEQVLAVNKPAGLRVIPDRFQADLPNLRDLLLQRDRKTPNADGSSIMVIHRIDAGTSGLVLFGRTAESHRILSMAFENNQVKKSYLAVVRGKVSPPADVIDLPIAAARRGNMKIDPDGLAAITRYEVMEQFRNYALLRVMPESGRTHQIRVHLQAVGYPLAVDPRYTHNRQLTISQIKYHKNNLEEEAGLISRLTLHAWKLEVDHPNRQKPLQLEAGLPKDFKGLIRALQKYNK